jgi:hypothetical protein
MAIVVRNLIWHMSCRKIFSMGGHEDGIFTFGHSHEDAGQLMISELVRARSIVE